MSRFDLMLFEFERLEDAHDALQRRWDEREAQLRALVARWESRYEIGDIECAADLRAVLDAEGDDESKGGAGMSDEGPQIPPLLLAMRAAESEARLVHGHDLVRCWVCGGRGTMQVTAWSTVMGGPTLPYPCDLCRGTGRARIPVDKDGRRLRRGRDGRLRPGLEPIDSGPIPGHGADSVDGGSDVTP